MFLILVEVPPTLAQLIEASGLKHEFIARQFGIDRVSWYKKRQNINAWSISDIHLLAKVIRKTPQEIFEALSHEAGKGPVTQIPG